MHALSLGLSEEEKNAAHRLPPLCEVCFFTQLPRSRLCVQRRVKQCVVWRWDRPGVCVIHHIKTTKSHSHLGADCEAVVRPHWHYMTTCLKCLNTPACTCGPSHSRSFEVYEPQCFFFFFFFFFFGQELIVWDQTAFTEVKFTDQRHGLTKEAAGQSRGAAG